MYFSHVLLTFKEEIPSAKDIDHEDIITKNVEKLFSRQPLKYMKYLKKTNNNYLKIYKGYQISRIMISLTLITFLNTLDVAFILLSAEILSILYAIYLDTMIYHFMDKNNLNKVAEFSNKSIYFAAYFYPIFIIFFVVKMKFFSPIQNLLTYQYYILSFKLAGLLGTFTMIRTMIYNFKYKSCIKTRNKLEEYRSKLFNSNYTCMTQSNMNYTINKIVNLKTEIPKKKHNDCCSICRENFKDKDIITELPCKHFYHKYCIKLWLKREFNCPYCRKIVF